MNTHVVFNSETVAIAGRERVALLEAGWHSDIVEQAGKSFVHEFSSLSDKQVETFSVPGAFELPLKAQQLAESGRYAAVVACALVVDGGIYRHDFVASAVVDGLMRVQLDTGVPVFSVSLTPHEFETQEHKEFFYRHFVQKGAEAAKACAEVLQGMSEQVL